MTQRIEYRYDIAYREILRPQNKVKRYKTSLTFDKRARIVKYYMLLVMQYVLQGGEFLFPNGGGIMGVYRRDRKEKDKITVAHGMTKKTGFKSYAIVPFRMKDIYNIIWDAPFITGAGFKFKAVQKTHRNNLFHILNNTDIQYRDNPWIKKDGDQ